MNTQLHITCIMTGISEYSLDCRTTCLWGKTVQNITTQTHYVLFREFSWLQNNKHGIFAFLSITFKLLQLLSKLWGLQT